VGILQVILCLGLKRWVSVFVRRGQRGGKGGLLCFEGGRNGGIHLLGLIRGNWSVRELCF